MQISVKVVHELKTPLTPIVASSDSLAEFIKEEPLKSMAINVNRGALNLNKRIDELLELARSELKVLQLNPSRLAPGDLSGTSFLKWDRWPPSTSSS